MKKATITIFIIIFFCSGVIFGDDLANYNLTITYPYLLESNRYLSSGDTLAVMKVLFEDIDTDTDNELARFWARITSDYAGAAASNYLEAAQLWWDTNGTDGLQINSDSLISEVVRADIPIQTSPTTEIQFSFSGNIPLGETSTFYVALVILDWRTDVDLEDQEIAAGIDGTYYGVTSLKTNNDILMTPPLETSNDNWGGDHTVHFTIQAENLNVVVRNLDQSAEESNNMFYPNYTAIDGSPASQNERITDLTFTSDVFLPQTFVGDSLQQATFWIGWDNTVLDIDTMYLGDLWDNAENTMNGQNFGVVVVDSTNPYFSKAFFECIAIGRPAYINSNSLAEVEFDVIKPGISPVFLTDINIWDQWGVRYHQYQTLQNNLSGATSEYDAWGKFISGDFTGGSVANDGVGNAEVDNSDITLFSNYMFLGTSSASWYDRFDIGAEGFRDPEGNPQYDDTTNFYDLLIIGTNYYRDQKGNFLQKETKDPADITLKINDNSVENSDLYYVRLSLENVDEMLSAQLKIQYEPDELIHLSHTLGNWAQNISPNHILLNAPQKDNGIIDLNYIALDNSLKGSGDFIDITFRKLCNNKPKINISSFDPRDIQGNKINFYEQKRVEQVPVTYSLYNYPNPFNPATEIVYSIPQKNVGNVQIKIYDLAGNEVKTLINKYHSPGNYKILWNSNNNQNIPVVSGIYFIKLNAPGINVIRKITLLQ